MRFSSFFILSAVAVLQHDGTPGLTATALPQQRQVVANGQDVTDPTRYPYFARIDFDGLQGCGGTLIHPEFILTAAHCFDFDRCEEEVTVFLGTLEFDDTDPIKQASVVNIASHPCWDERDRLQLHDIALIQIYPPITNIAPVKFNTNPNLPSAGDQVTVMGFGLIETQDYLDTLQEVDLFVTSDDMCNTENFETGGISATHQICALDAADNQDACEGDSGGPLISKQTMSDEYGTPDMDIQVGVVSSGDGECGQNSASGVYIEVAYYSDWIQFHICENAATNSTSADECTILVEEDVESLQECTVIERSCTPGTSNSEGNGGGTMRMCIIPCVSILLLVLSCTDLL